MSKPITESILSNETRVFLMCCDFRSFSAVAHALGITQSAVSKIIRKFEDSIGFELFIRNSRPLTLTPEAHLLHRQLRGLKGEMTRSLSSLQSKNYIKPILRIGILESLHLNLGVAILKNLLPNLSQVVMRTASANVLIQRLIERKLDLIITNDVSTEPSHVFRRLLFHEPSVLILPKSFEKDPNQNWTWQRLAVCGLPLIRYWNESGAGEINEMFMKTHGLRFPDKISVDTNSLLVTLVSQGIGWGFSRPTTVLENIHMHPHFIVREMQKPSFSREVYLIGREQEFVVESEIIADIAKQFVQENIIPESLKFAPWVQEGFTVG